MAGLLIVEDEVTTRNNLVHFYDWKKLGFDWVEEAADGSTALRLIGEKTPDVVITDIKMPCMTGMELAEKLEQQDKPIAVVVISAYMDVSYFRQAIKFRVSDYILKPIQPKELQQAVVKALESVQNNRLYHAAYRFAAQAHPEEFRMAQASPLTEAPDAGEPALVNRIKQLVEQNYMLANFSINFIATELHYTGSYLCMVFKQHTEQTINDYITLVRIHNAKMLLSEFSLKLYEIAEMVGFSDENYFSKVFKKQTGETPAAYRKHGGARK